MKKNKLIKLTFIGILGMLVAAGCAKNGSNGTTGSTGVQGATGPALPSVTWVMPIPGATGVYMDSVVKVGFSNQMDPTTINTSTFVISSGGVNVTGTVSYNAGSQTAFFSPNLPLSAFGSYTATLTTGIKDTAGNPLTAGYTWTFIAGASSAPSSLYVADWSLGRISVFNNASSANGNIFPDRVISGAATGLNAPSIVWFDKASDTLYVANHNSNSILVFNNASTINGNIAPARVISGAATTLSEPYSVWYDQKADSLYVGECGTNTVLVFNNASTANGNVAPARTISGLNTGLNCPQFLWYDAASDELYVSNWGSSIEVFNNASTINGNVTPARTISGTTTTLQGPADIWLDNSSNQLYVADYQASSITVFDNASTANGDIAPARIISGASTTLADPWGIWLDSANDRLYVGNYYGSQVLVFNSASTINGNVAPSRTISGPNTGLSGPSGVWLDLNP